MKKILFALLTIAVCATLAQAKTAVITVDPAHATYLTDVVCAETTPAAEAANLWGERLQPNETVAHVTNLLPGSTYYCIARWIDPVTNIVSGWSAEVQAVVPEVTAIPEPVQLPAIPVEGATTATITIKFE